MEIDGVILLIGHRTAGSQVITLKTAQCPKLSEFATTANSQVTCHQPALRQLRLLAALTTMVTVVMASLTSVVAGESSNRKRLLAQPRAVQHAQPYEIQIDRQTSNMKLECKAKYSRRSLRKKIGSVPTQPTFTTQVTNKTTATTNVAPAKTHTMTQ